MANFSKSAALYQLHDANFLKTALREPIRKEGSLSTSLFLKIWSGRRVSNSRPQPWQGCALPTELLPLHICPAKNLNYTRTFRSVKSKTKKIKKFWIFFSHPLIFNPLARRMPPGGKHIRASRNARLPEAATKSLPTASDAVKAQTAAQAKVILAVTSRDCASFGGSRV